MKEIILKRPITNVINLGGTETYKEMNIWMTIQYLVCTDFSHIHEKIVVEPDKRTKQWRSSNNFLNVPVYLNRSCLKGYIIIQITLYSCFNMMNTKMKPFSRTGTDFLKVYVYWATKWNIKEIWKGKLITDTKASLLKK